MLPYGVFVLLLFCHRISNLGGKVLDNDLGLIVDLEWILQTSEFK